MNAYDFDKCIYSGDCTIDFYRFCLRRHKTLLRYAPRQLWGFVLYAFGFIQKTALKEYFFRFLRGIDEIDLVVDAFWQEHFHKMTGWYLAQKADSDLIISASPEFLLRPCCRLLGVSQLVASRVNKKTGEFTGENCYGEEKPKRLQQDLGIAAVDAFYSDSLSDLPMARITAKSYLVTNEQFTDMLEYRMSGLQKIKRKFLSFEFFRFLVVGGINTFNGVVLSYVFSKFLTAQIAFWCGYVLSLSISYLLNSWITFHEKLHVQKMLRFFVSYIPNFLVQNLVVYLVHGMFGGSELLAFILAAAIGIPVTFLLIKLFAFRKSKAE